MYIMYVYVCIIAVINLNKNIDSYVLLKNYYCKENILQICIINIFEYFYQNKIIKYIVVHLCVLLKNIKSNFIFCNYIKKKQ